MGALRSAGLIAGTIAAFGVLMTRRGLTRYVDRLKSEPTLAGSVSAGSVSAGSDPAAEPERGRAVARGRLVVGGVGVLILLFGLWKVLHAARPADLPWILVWLLGAVVLHDGVLVPVVTLLRAGSNGGLHRLPQSARAVVRSGFVVAGVFALVVVPAAWAKHLGPANPTVLPGDYGRRLLVLVGVIAAATVVVVVVTLLRRIAFGPGGSRARSG